MLPKHVKALIEHLYQFEIPGQGVVKAFVAFFKRQAERQAAASDLHVTDNANASRGLAVGRKCCLQHNAVVDRELAYG